MLAQAVDKVALGDDSGDSATIDHGQRADSSFTQATHDIEQGRIPGDRLDGSPLSVKDRCDGHDVSPDSPFRLS